MDLLARPACQAPLLPGAGVLAFINIGFSQGRACGHKMQGAVGG